MKRWEKKKLFLNKYFLFFLIFAKVILIKGKFFYKKEEEERVILGVIEPKICKIQNTKRYKRMRAQTKGYNSYSYCIYIYTILQENFHL